MRRARWPTTAANALYVENVQPGLFLKDPKTGKRLLLGASTEDVRVLDITGPFDKGITRVDGSVDLPSTFPQGVLTAGQKAIPYATRPIANFRYMAVDGYDWEFNSDLTAISLYDGKGVVADVRLRRDAGALAVFAKVIDDSPFPAAKLKPEESFGKGDGIEIVLGPDGPGPGNTRIFLTAQREKDRVKGVALACRPGSAPLKLNDKSVDFSKGLVEIPGAAVAVRERFDGLGYDLEAEIPLDLLPELVSTKTVHVKRYDQKERKVREGNEEHLDLAGSVRYNVAVWRAGRRSAWQDDGTPSSPLAMKPAAWGRAVVLKGTGEGSILGEMWKGTQRIPASGTPSVTEQLKIFESPMNIGDNYCQRLRGYLHPPVSGAYTFHVAADDTG